MVTVDMPGVGAGEIEWLVGRLDGMAVMCSDRGRRAVLEPFPLVVRTSAPELIARRLAARPVSRCAARRGGGERRAGAGEVAERVWTNLNRPQDLEAFLRG